MGRHGQIVADRESEDAAASKLTPFERFDQLFTRVISVPKAQIDRDKKKRAQKRRAKRRG